MKKHALRSLRVALGIGKARFALHAGLSQRTISALEGGERMGRPSTWAVISRTLKDLGVELGEGKANGRG
jgi:transcriptional regulator with XRE-family HTH domain